MLYQFRQRSSKFDSDFVRVSRQDFHVFRFLEVCLKPSSACCTYKSTVVYLITFHMQETDGTQLEWSTYLSLLLGCKLRLATLTRYYWLPNFHSFSVDSFETANYIVQQCTMYTLWTFSANLSHTKDEKKERNGKWLKVVSRISFPLSLFLFQLSSSSGQAFENVHVKGLLG